MSRLFTNITTNIPLYPEWIAYLKDRRPSTWQTRAEFCLKKDSRDWAPFTLRFFICAACKSYLPKKQRDFWKCLWEQ
jgi:hypothetical protein